VTEKTHKPKISSLNELFPDRSFKSKVESNRNKFESPKNTFEMNYNRLFKEFKSTDHDSLISHDSLDRRKIRRNKSGISIDTKEEKIHLKALQSNIENKNSKKNVKSKLRELKIVCLTQNFNQRAVSPMENPYAYRQKLFTGDNPSSLSPEFLFKTENKLKSNDFISDKMKSKIINVYKKANQSGAFESEMNKNSFSNLTEISLMSHTPIGRKEINYNSVYNINNSVYSVNSTNLNNPKIKSRKFLYNLNLGLKDTSPISNKLKLAQKQLTSLLKGNENNKDKRVISKIKSICDEHPKAGLKGDYKTFLNFGKIRIFYYLDHSGSPNNMIVSKIIKKFPDVVRSKHSLNFKRMVSFNK
jgi:hypothetical protein